MKKSLIAALLVLPALFAAPAGAKAEGRWAPTARFDHTVTSVSVTPYASRRVYHRVGKHRHGTWHPVHGRIAPRGRVLPRYGYRVYRPYRPYRFVIRFD